jgi:hypothetical protein
MTLLMAALLTACGGGGSDEVSPPPTALDTAARYAAHGSLAVAEGGAAVDIAVQTAQAIIAAQASTVATATATTRSAAAASPAAASIAPSTTLACAGGGAVRVSASGPTLAGLYNGSLDPGEAYALSFTDCRGSAGAATVNGSLTLAAAEVGTGSLNLLLTAEALSVALPRGSITVDGSLGYSAIDALPDGGDGSSLRESSLTSSQLTLRTRRGSGQQSFTVTALAVQRSSLWAGGLLQSSTMNGSARFTAALGDTSYTATLTTAGSTRYAADGLPTGGSWTLALPNSLLGLTIAATSATLTVDDGRNGSIDRMVTVPVSVLVAAAD